MSVDRRFRTVPAERLSQVTDAARSFAQALAGSGHGLAAAAAAYGETFAALPEPEVVISEEEWDRCTAALPDKCRHAAAELLIPPSSNGELRSSLPVGLAAMMAMAVRAGLHLAQCVSEED